jgi:hypothetical protein
MSRDQLFNAANSEYVLQQTPNQNGDDFNLLHGAGPNALPFSLGTAQGNSNPNYQGEQVVNHNVAQGNVANQIQQSIPSTPFGTLVRNPNIASLSDQITVSGVVVGSTVVGTSLSASDSFANIAIAFNSFSGTFAQGLPYAAPFVINTVYATNSTSAATFPLSSVNASGAGWSQNASGISWTNGVYPNFSGAAGALAIPTSGSTYYLNITYYNTVPGGILDPGLVGALSVPQSVENAWIGNNVFGKSVYGSPEVQILNYSGTRDTISEVTNQNPTLATDVIPSVGSRFYRG